MSMISCAGVNPSDDEVYRGANRQLTEARADPIVARYAKIPLNDASITLQQALQAEDLAELRHLSYVGQKKVEIARAVAQTRQADDALDGLRKRERAAIATKKARRAAAAPSPRVETMPAPPQANADDDAAREAVVAAAAAAEKEATQARRLANSLPDFKVHDDDRNTVITLPEESFSAGSTTLDAGVADRLDALAAFLKENADRKVIVNGHTDNTGVPQINIRISNARAESVKARLVKLGIPEMRIITIGYGHNRPIASNETPEGRRANRRVEVVLMHPAPRTDAAAPSSVSGAPGGSAVQWPGRKGTSSR